MSVQGFPPFRLVHDQARQLATAAVWRAPDGWHVVIKPPSRSLDQNARLHAMIAEAVKGGLATDAGRRLDEEDAKTAFVTGWMIDNGMASDIVAFNGRPVQLRRSTTTFSKEELGSLMDFIETECVKRGIQLRETT
ncbi:MAG: recombination protein NinB [Hyphomonadaceae bacterium]|nr:recombination protein NinB [Hyphomonadaceae bacterium]